MQNHNIKSKDAEQESHWKSLQQNRTTSKLCIKMFEPNPHHQQLRSSPPTAREAPFEPSAASLMSNRHGGWGCGKHIISPRKMCPRCAYLYNTLYVISIVRTTGELSPKMLHARANQHVSQQTHFDAQMRATANRTSWRCSFTQLYIYIYIYICMYVCCT